MADVSIYKLSPKVNYLDPIVRHDPELQKSLIAKPNLTDDNEKSIDKEMDQDFDVKNIEAIYVPIVRVNMRVVSPQFIVLLKINYDSFLPSLQLIVTQQGDEIKTVDNPGLDNIITVVMTTRRDGAYKSISLDFYINRIQIVGKDVYYWASYKLLALEQAKTKQVTFNPAPSNGCQAKYCSLGPNEHPTTFEFLHVLALECGLGFAATDQVKEISDDKYRFITNQKYRDVMEQHLKFGGIDEESIFDGWVDLYRYLVVVNVPWVLAQEITNEDIGMTIEFQSLAGEESSGDRQDSSMCQRFLTNWTQAIRNTNIGIRSYEWITNNAAIRNEGSLNNYIIGAPSGYKDENNGSVSQHDVEVIENSNDGTKYRDEYMYSKSSFLGHEMGNADEGYTPVLLQEKIRDNYFRKIRARRLKIVLEKSNFGLQRGTLVYLLIVNTSDKSKKMTLKPINGMDDPEVRRIVEDDIIPIPDKTFSDFYYIDGMEFRYSNDTEGITQTLYLIKQHPYNAMQTKSDPLKIEG